MDIYNRYFIMMGLNNYTLTAKETNSYDERDNITLITDEKNKITDGNNELKLLSTYYINTNYNTDKIKEMFEKLYDYIIKKEEVKIILSKTFYKIIAGTDCFDEIYRKMEDKYTNIVNTFIQKYLERNM